MFHVAFGVCRLRFEPLDSALLVQTLNGKKQMQRESILWCSGLTFTW